MTTGPAQVYGKKLLQRKRIFVICPSRAGERIVGPHGQEIFKLKIIKERAFSLFDPEEYIDIDENSPAPV